MIAKKEPVGNEPGRRKSKMEIEFFRTSSVSSQVLLQCLVGVALFIGFAIYLSYQYQWFKKVRRFREEMELLELNPAEENLLTKMIHRYRLNEPVDMLLSLRLFDELATKEMHRVLESPGSSAAKQGYIEMVYEIRQRTFFQEYAIQNVEQNIVHR